MLYLMTSHCMIHSNSNSIINSCVINIIVVVLSAIVSTPNLPTNIVDFRGFDSSAILNSRGGILMFMGDFPEKLSPAMLVGTMLVGRLCVPRLVSHSASLNPQP